MKTDSNKICALYNHEIIHAAVDNKISVKEFNEKTFEEIQIMSEGDDLSGYLKVFFPESFK